MTYKVAEGKKLLYLGRAYASGEEIPTTKMHQAMINQQVELGNIVPVEPEVKTRRKAENEST